MGRLFDSVWGKVMVGCLALYFLLTIIPGSHFVWYGLAPSACMLGVPMLVLLVAVLIVRVRMPQIKWWQWASILAVVGYVGVCIVQSHSAYHDKLYDGMVIVGGCVFYVLGIHVVLAKLMPRTLLWLIIGVGLLNLYFLVAQKMPDWGLWSIPDVKIATDKEVALTGMFQYKNVSGSFFVIVGFFLLCYAIVQKSRWWVGLPAVVFLAAAFATGSRAVYPNVCIGLVVCVIAYLFSIYHTPHKFYVVAVGLLLSGGVAVSSFVYYLSVSTRLLGLITKPFVLGDRVSLLGVAWNLMPNAPWYGYGARSYEDMAIPYYPFATAPNFVHNEYVQLAFDYGMPALVLGLVILVGHFVWGLVSLFRKKGEENTPQTAAKVAALCVLAIMMFHAYYDFIWHNPTLVACAGLCLGIVSASPTPARAATWLNRGVLVALAMGVAMFCWVFAVSSNGIATLCKVAEWRLDNRGNDVYRYEQDFTALRQAISISHDPVLSHHYAAIELNKLRRMPDSPERTAQAREILEHVIQPALEKSPLNQLLPLDAAIARGCMNQYIEADAIVYGYAYPPVDDPKRYNNTIYPWRTYYLDHLMRWAEYEMSSGCNNQALFLVTEAQQINNARRFNPHMEKWWTREKKATVAAQLKSFEQILLMQDATPISPREK